MKKKRININNINNSILNSAFDNANHCKAALQKIKVSTLYLVIANQWWLSQADVHMAKMYGSTTTDTKLKC